MPAASKIRAPKSKIPGGGHTLPPGSAPFVPTRIPYRGFGSMVFLPNWAELAALGPDYMPFWFTIFDSNTDWNGAVGAGATAYAGIVQEPDCWIYALTGNTTLVGGGAGSFTVQVFDQDRQALWMDTPILFGNVLGSANYPFYLKRLVNMPSDGALQASIVNLSATANNIQVVACAYRKDLRSGKVYTS